MKKEYIIVGSDNHWYAGGLTSKAQVKEEIKNIFERPEVYGKNNSDMPEKIYVFKGEFQEDLSE